MIHYKIPLQRKNSPGNPNLATSMSKEWYVFIPIISRTKKLNNIDINIVSMAIPDALLQGISKKEYTDYSKVQLHDSQNTSINGDGTIDSMIFKQDVQQHRIQKSKKNDALVSRLLPKSEPISVKPTAND